jgi:RIO-like serine/threonine protein kinase
MEPFFSDNVPVMAYVVYRTLVHWQVFEKDDNKLLSKIISTIETAVQVSFVHFISTSVYHL